MDDFDNLIERYRRELMEFSKNNCSKPAVSEQKSNQEEICTECKVMPVEKEQILPVNTQPKEEADTHEMLTDTADTETEKAEKAEVDYSQASRENSVGNMAVPKFRNYEEFLRNNPQNGSLKVQVFAADHAFPVPSARVVVVLELLNGTREFFDGLTDINGIVDDIILPAPARENSQSPSDSPALPYASYTTYVEHPDFVDARYTDVPVFAGIKSIQGVELIPLVSVGNEPKYVETDEGNSFERLKGVM
ncbi:MAG: hypothetical protein MJ147_03800 [Clostridia bacterium]|nr:hypothetical protein [Clostridia bacterium]